MSAPALANDLCVPENRVAMKPDLMAAQCQTRLTEEEGARKVAASNKDFQT